MPLLTHRQSGLHIGTGFGTGTQSQISSPDRWQHRCCCVQPTPWVVHLFSLAVTAAAAGEGIGEGRGCWYWLGYKGWQLRLTQCLIGKTRGGAGPYEWTGSIISKFTYARARTRINVDRQIARGLFTLSCFSKSALSAWGPNPRTLTLTK